MFMKKKCLFCNQEFETHTKQMYCCKDHQIIGKNRLKFPNESDYVECKICGFRAIDLHAHIKKMHHISIDEYCKQFNINEIDLILESYRKHNSEMQKKAYAEGRLHGWGRGDKNPSRRKEVREGRKSIFSKNYEGYDGLTDEEKNNKILSIFKLLAKQKKEERNNPLTIEYYIKRGFTEKEAKQQLKNRQTTFSYQKCIDTYGEELGKHKFEERQQKWQNTLKSKPIEEIERINKSKLGNGRGYSNISQQLFNQIMQILGNTYQYVFYATNDPNKDFNEYMVHDDEMNCNYFLDFYIADINKVIEFDGDYWHSERRGNQQRDKEREQNLKRLGYVNIFHVKERDYRLNKEKTIQECIKFIQGK